VAIPLAGTTPRSGDVVVTRESHPHLHYTLRQLPGLVQFSSGQPEAAFWLASSFAAIHAVDAWYTEGEGSYRLFESCRFRVGQPPAGSDLPRSH
jgi:hypothetical protein